MTDSIIINNKDFVITGKLFTTVRVKEEWYQDVDDPEATINSLKSSRPSSDIFTFWQLPPDFEPRYGYRMEWDFISALPIKSFEYWWKEQVPYDVRKNVKKSVRRGLVVRPVIFNDDFVKGIVDIYNEAPVKRGKRFRHYGKDFETVKNEMLRDADRSDFIGAFVNDELIGFYQMIYTKNLAQPGVSLSKMKYRDKKADDALIAKAVELCEKKGIQYFTYGLWRRGGHADFLSRRGFEKMRLPRYYVPLTLKGKIALKLNLHKGIKGILPEKFKKHLLKLRARWYEMKYADKLAELY